MTRTQKARVALLGILFATSALLGALRADAADAPAGGAAAAALEDQGKAAAQSGDFDQAVGSLSRASALAPDNQGDHDALADAQCAWADSLLKAGQYEDALSHYKAAFDLDRGPRVTNATVDLQGEGNCLEALSRYGEAVTVYQQELALNRQENDRIGEAQSLGSLGEVYRHLSRYDRAVDYARQGLSALGDSQAVDSRCFLLLSLGASYDGLSRYGEAVAVYQQALALQQAADDRNGEGQTLYHIGAAYFNQGDYEKSAQFSAQSLKFLSETHDLASEDLALSNLGAACQALGNDDKALDDYQQGLGLTHMTGDLQGESLVLSNLMTLSQQANNLRLAIFYGKMAVNLYQTIRAGISGLDPETQKSYLHSIAKNYRVLAGLLITSGRLLEAQQILDLLKEEEYLNFVNRDPAQTAAVIGQADLTPAEAQWYAGYSGAAARVAALGAKEQPLLADRTRTPDQERQLAALETDLTAANQAFEAFLSRLDKEAADKEAAGKAGGDAIVTPDAKRLRGELQTLGPGVVALYTLVNDDKYSVVLYTPDTQTSYSYPITSKSLLQKVVQFRAALKTPKSDPRPPAHQLYDILLGPLAADLKAAHAKTLMWSLDGPLRYIPMAALFDGQHYLVEDYQNVVFTPASTGHLDDAPASDWKGLGLGVSKQMPGFPALPAVPAELHSIIRGDTGQGGVVPGDVKIDENFTSASINDLAQQHYQLIHIASHFSFNPGSDSDSYLLLGDGGHLTLDQIKGMPNLFAGVDLLTLSACDTAIGDIEEQDGGANGKEVECLGVLAQRQGAKAVMASLWPVSDDSTRQLMDQFYRLRNGSGDSKAEALRQAQLALLRGAIKPTDPAVLLLYPNASYAHPYYWAPFILIGNWR